MLQNCELHKSKKNTEVLRILSKKHQMTWISNLPLFVLMREPQDPWVLNASDNLFERYDFPKH